jgi:Na+-transporting NADH:ubiquinone oxidoreductase subunit B
MKRDDHESSAEKKGSGSAILRILAATVKGFIYPPGTASSSAPHVLDAISMKRILLIYLCALVPVLFMALYNTGYQANLALANIDNPIVPGWRGTILTLMGTAFDPRNVVSNLTHGMLYFAPVLITAFVVGTFWEILFAVTRKREINEMFIVTILLFSLIMPPTIPLWQVALGISFGIVLGKEVFGGFGMNILNPALLGYAFLFFAYPAQISGNAVWIAVDGVTGATPLAVLENPSLSTSVNWMDAFIGLVPGAMGETSALACLIGACIMLFAGIASWRVILGLFAGAVSLAWIFNIIGSDTNYMFGITPLWHVVLGGFAFGAVFMATDPVTGAMTLKGQFFYGLLVGLLAILIRVLNPAYTEGMMLAILFGNVFAPAIDKAVILMHIRTRQARNAA